MNGWGGEELRRAALELLGEHADERARSALTHASVTVTDAARWDGSAGPIEARRVTLGLDARTMGKLRAAPAVTDALCAALAAAIATRPGEALLHLDVRWAGGPRAASAGYRDAPPPAAGDALQDALVDYLEGVGHPQLARVIANAVVDTSVPTQVTLRPTAGSTRKGGDAIRGDPQALAAITAALRDLLGEEKTRVRVR